MNNELAALAPYAVGVPGTIFVLWALGKFGAGEWMGRKQCDEQISIRKESEDRAWATVAEVRTELKESTRVADKLADAVADLTAAINDGRGTRR